VETLPAVARNELGNDARLVQEAMRSGISHGRHTAAHMYWHQWLHFCRQYELVPYLTQGSNAIGWLQIFAQRVRNGRLSASHNNVQAGTMADAITFVASAHTMAGLPDPHLILGSHTIDPCLARLICAYRKLDPAPDRVQLIPLNVLRHACRIAQSAVNPTSLAAADLMWMAFFFFLHPGIYTDNSDSAHPFTLADVRLWVGTTQIDPLTASLDSLRSATFVALVFSDKKNAVCGEVVGHGLLGHLAACPVKAIVRCLTHLRSHNAAATTPLSAVGPTLHHLTTHSIIKLLRQGGTVYLAMASNPLPPIHLKALHATGAMALLGRDVQTSKIQLIGRWKSDSMLRYLQLQSHATMSHYTNLMLQQS
jgi:hypothetical protein